jgi:hypothetical protein
VRSSDLERIKKKRKKREKMERTRDTVERGQLSTAEYE